MCSPSELWAWVLSSFRRTPPNPANLSKTGLEFRETETAMSYYALFKSSADRNTRYEQFLRAIAETDNTVRTRNMAISALCGDEYDESRFFPHG